MRFCFYVAILAAWLSPAQSFALDYPDKGAYPTPMWGTTFRVADPLNPGATFNDDGTNSTQPVTDAGSVTLGGIKYLLKKLTILPPTTGSDAITFQGKSYAVYSAVPENMTIDYAYKHAGDPGLYYAQDTITTAIDFTIPATINGGNATTVTNPPPAAPVLATRTQENVYTTAAPEDNSKYFVPNFPNTAGQHNGLTANIYFVGDPFIGKPGYWPDTAAWPLGTFHLTPYGWALDPRTVAQAYTVFLLDQTGGAGDAHVIYEATPALRNVWKHTIQGFDKISDDPEHYPADPAHYTVPRDLKAPFFAAIKTDPNYPFPAKAHQSGDYPSWFRDAGSYFHVQPMPGFQRNLLRFYTSWGAYCLYNQTSDLFVRADGTIELPAVHTDSGWRYAPIVTQTWDASQRYTVLNLTSGPIPSTYDDYPGAEYYLPGNLYLPGQAGVMMAYVDYLVQDLNGLSPRETDLWMGLKNDGAKDMLFWGDAPVNNVLTEPGGQANKPYMFGASTRLEGVTRYYYCRLQSSNSFPVARLTQSALAGKLYDASFYVDAADGQGYRRIATLRYQWRPWTIDASGNWAKINDGYGAYVPQLVYAHNAVSGVAIQAAKGLTWDPTARKLKYDVPQNVTGNLQDWQNALTKPPVEYLATGHTTNAGAKFLIVLSNPDITPAYSELLLEKGK